MNDTIRLTPKEQSTTEGDNYFEILYHGDTLSMKVEYSHYKDNNAASTTRLTGIGIIQQLISFRYGEEGYSNISDRLLYFYNGVDTIWKAE